jgi:hypothetical protein
MPPEARGRSFDELARGLASGEVSRLRALKLMGASLLGVVSLGLLGGVAQAQPDCERDCRVPDLSARLSASIVMSFASTAPSLRTCVTALARDVSSVVLEQARGTVSGTT